MSTVDYVGLWESYDDENEIWVGIQVRNEYSLNECSLCGLMNRYRLDHLANQPGTVTWHEFLCKNCTAGALTEYTKIQKS